MFWVRRSVSPAVTLPKKVSNISGPPVPAWATTASMNSRNAGDSTAKEAEDIWKLMV